MCVCFFSNLQQLGLRAVHVSGVGHVQEWPAYNQVAHHSGQVCRETTCWYMKKKKYTFETIHKKKNLEILLISFA